MFKQPNLEANFSSPFLKLNANWPFKLLLIKQLFHTANIRRNLTTNKRNVNLNWMRHWPIGVKILFLLLIMMLFRTASSKAIILLSVRKMFDTDLNKQLCLHFFNVLSQKKNHFHYIYLSNPIVSTSALFFYSSYSINFDRDNITFVKYSYGTIISYN